MPHSVRITPEATDDLTAIAAYIAQDSPAASLRFVERLQQRIGLLKHFPGRHGAAGEAGRFGIDLREMVHGMYRVLYTFDDREVVVHAVLHGARRPLRSGEVKFGPK